MVWILRKPPWQITLHVLRLKRKDFITYVICGREDFGWLWNPLYTTCNDIKELVRLGFCPASIWTNPMNHKERNWRFCSLINWKRKCTSFPSVSYGVYNFVICPRLFPHTNMRGNSNKKLILLLQRNREQIKFLEDLLPFSSEYWNKSNVQL
jgi:hypothetical protein